MISTGDFQKKPMSTYESIPASGYWHLLGCEHQVRISTAASTAAASADAGTEGIELNLDEQRQPG